MTGGEPVEQVAVVRLGAHDVIEVDIPVLGARRCDVTGRPAMYSALMPDQVTDDPVRATRYLGVKPSRLGCGTEPLSGVVKMGQVLVNVHE